MPRRPGIHARRIPVYAYLVATENAILCPACAARSGMNIPPVPDDDLQHVHRVRKPRPGFCDGEPPLAHFVFGARGSTVPAPSAVPGSTVSLAPGVSSVATGAGSLGGCGALAAPIMTVARNHAPIRALRARPIASAMG
jgi:hypothetical protein